MTETVGSYQSLSSRQSKLTGYKGTIQLYNDKITDPLYIKQPLPEVQEGDVVRVKVTQHPDENKAFEGQMLEIIGHKDDVGIDILEVLLRYENSARIYSRNNGSDRSNPRRINGRRFCRA